MTPAGNGSSTKPATRGSTGPRSTAVGVCRRRSSSSTSRSTPGPNVLYISVNFVGVMHAGPTLIAEGTDEQRAFHLPRILRGRHGVVPGLLRALGRVRPRSRSRPVRCVRANEYVVNGQKISRSTRWYVADWCELLVRTDPEAPKHKGITWLILDMHQARRRGAADADPSTGRATSARCSSRCAGSRRATGSATRTTAGGSRTSPCASSGARPRAAHHHPALSCASSSPRREARPVVDPGLRAPRRPARRPKSRASGG